MKRLLALREKIVDSILDHPQRIRPHEEVSELQAMWLSFLQIPSGYDARGWARELNPLVEEITRELRRLEKKHEWHADADERMVLRPVLRSMMVLPSVIDQLGVELQRMFTRMNATAWFDVNLPIIIGSGALTLAMAALTIAA